MKSSVRQYLALGAILLAVAAAVPVYLLRSSRPEQQVIAPQSQTISPGRAASDIVASTSAPQQRNDAKLDVRASDWGERFRNAKDYFEFVSSAAQAALQGNGRAAYYIDVVLSNCTQIIESSKTSNDPEKEYLDNYHRMLPYAPQKMFDAASAEAHKCARLGNEDAFADLPNREGGYSKAFWRELALKDNDPLAEAAQLQTDLPKLPQIKSPADRRLAVDRLRTYVHDAVNSKNPEAIFAIGIALQNGRTAHGDNLQAVAVSLAACDLGYDCSSTQSQNYRLVCSPVGACPEGATYSDRLQQIYGATRYAEIYTQAQVFKDLLAREDWQEIDKFVRIDGP